MSSSSAPTSSSSFSSLWERRSTRESKTTNRLTGYGSGSTAVVESHVITDGFPEFTIKTADGRTLKGSDAELWDYRDLLNEYRLKKNPSTKWVSGYYKIERTLEERVFKGRWFQLIKWQGFEDPLWNTWIRGHEMKDARDVLKKRKSVSKRRSENPIHRASPPRARYTIQMTSLDESGPMAIEYL
ncbi:unnamed protein product [Caenorhabditis nigoni]